MKEDLSTYLPPEMIIDILSRLPIPTIMRCKFVCKSWLNFIESPEFANSHHSKSVPGLAVSQELLKDEPYKIFEFIDELNPRCRAHCFNRSFDISFPFEFIDELNPQYPARCFNRSFNFNFNFPHPKLIIHSSVDGLLFLHSSGRMPLYICNPITRDYIELPNSRERPSYSNVCGFGVSKITGQYNLVMIYPAKCKCVVYTLGIGSWRSIAEDSGNLKYRLNDKGVFLNGNLHWLVLDLKSRTLRISCFELETELFSTFSLPSLRRRYNPPSLTALEDHLCLCYDLGGDICIWLMKAYGDEKSWTRKFVINKKRQEILLPIKVYKDGDILIAEENGPELLRFSTKTNTIRTINLSGLHADARTSTVIYTPSFLPVLKTLVPDNWDSFRNMHCVIWFMSEYGDEKYWTKEFTIREECCGCMLYGPLFPIKVFINSDILIASEYNSEIFCYSKTIDAIHNTGIHKRDPLTSNVLLPTSAFIYTPTFLPLRTLLMVTENVTSF